MTKLSDYVERIGTTHAALMEKIIRTMVEEGLSIEDISIICTPGIGGHEDIIWKGLCIFRVPHIKIIIE